MLIIADLRCMHVGSGDGRIFMYSGSLTLAAGREHDQAIKSKPEALFLVFILSFTLNLSKVHL